MGFVLDVWELGAPHRDSRSVATSASYKDVDVIYPPFARGDDTVSVVQQGFLPLSGRRPAFSGLPMRLPFVP